MEKHFCTCPATDCPRHPHGDNESCDPCIQKNLELGEVPACFWNNVSNITGTTEYSMENFAKYVLKHMGGN